MLNITPFGWFHTAISLVSLFGGLYGLLPGFVERGEQDRQGGGMRDVHGSTLFTRFYPQGKPCARPAPKKEFAMPQTRTWHEPTLVNCRLR